MKKYKLGDICEIVSGSTPKTNITEFWDGDVKWITPAELDENTYIITDSVRKITNLAMQKTGLTAFPAGTVILSSRAPIGKVALAGCKMCCNQGFKNFICSEIVNNKYLYWFLKHNTAYLNSLGRGATFKEISKSIVSSIEIDLPSLEEQKRVVDNIEKISTIITLRKKEISILDDLIKARFVEMFGDLVENPRGYYVATLQDLIEKGFITYHLDGNHGGDYPRSEEFVESGIPYISANCIVHGEIDFAKAKYLTPERAGKLRKGIAQNEDVLFAHNATVGPTVVLHTDEEKVILGTSLTAYRCNQEEILPNYLKAYMLSNGFVRQYSSEMKQTTRNQVPITAQKKYQFLIPPIEEQKQFTVFVNQIDKSKLLSGCRLFHSWAPENRDKPKHVGVPQRKTKVLRGGRRQQ